MEHILFSIYFTIFGFGLAFTVVFSIGCYAASDKRSWIWLASMVFGLIIAVAISSKFLSLLLEQIQIIY